MFIIRLGHYLELHDLGLRLQLFFISMRCWFGKARFDLHGLVLHLVRLRHGHGIGGGLQLYVSSSAFLNFIGAARASIDARYVCLQLQRR